MNYYFSIYIIIIFFIVKISICDEKKEIKYIITNFTSKFPYKDEKNYFYENHTNNYLFAKLKLGSNEQTVEMKIDLNLYETYIVKNDTVDTRLYEPYDAYSSKTFNTSIRFFSQKNEYSSALLANDTLIVNNGQKNIKLDNFTFAFVDSGYNKIPGSIGFNLMNTAVYPKESMNYIDQLKNNSLISGYSLTILFKSNYNGQLLIGADYDEIMPEELLSNYGLRIKASQKGIIDNGKWQLDLNKVLVGDSELLYPKYIRFDLKNDFIIATEEYSEFIFKNFFSKYLGKRKCKKEELSSFKYYVGIKCQKDIDLQEFPDLTFYIASSLEQFKLVLNYEDLFEEIGEYKYFKIIIIINDISTIKISEYWNFGKQFFKSYIVTFNKERKDITIYYKETKKKEKSSSDSSDSSGSSDSTGSSGSSGTSKKVWLWILLSILIVMTGVIIYLLIICIKQGKIIKRRKRLNFLQDELEDENIN